MSIEFTQEIRELINDKTSIKALATVSMDGEVHVVYKSLIIADEENNIIILELSENTITGSNLIYSLWFNKQAALNILSDKGKSFHLKLLPTRAVISGKEFEHYYEYVQTRMENVDLSTVWFLKPLEISDTSLYQRMINLKKEYPLISHLDQLMR